MKNTNLDYLNHEDSEIAGLLRDEEKRRSSVLSMIASESIAPKAVHAALGSIFNDKTAEGYPGNRYHTGCGIVDKLEHVTIERAKSIFNAEHANVQPHSGVNANLAVYKAVLNIGDTVLSMNLSHGGHLSHGDKVSITGDFYNFIHYGINRETGYIDYAEMETLAEKYRPKLIIAGASSYPRLIDYKKFWFIADKIGAFFLVDMAHIAGLVAAKVIESPVPYADFVTFTTYKTLMGSHGGIILCREKFKQKIDRAIFPGTQGTPSLSLVAAKAVTLKLAASDQFRKIQKSIITNAKTLCGEFKRLGYNLVSGGTDSHLFLIDLRKLSLTGDICEGALENAGILVNRNLIPYDPETTMKTSGLRIGTTEVTMRGMGEREMHKIAELIDKIIKSHTDESAIKRAGSQVRELCDRFPLKNSFFNRGSAV